MGAVHVDMQTCLHFARQGRSQAFLEKTIDSCKDIVSIEDQDLRARLAAKGLTKRPSKENQDCNIRVEDRSNVARFLFTLFV